MKIDKSNLVLINCITVIVTLTLWFSSAPAAKQQSVTLTEQDLSYAIYKMNNESATMMPSKRSMPGGGVDGFTVLAIYPAITPGDFLSVRGIDGDYTIKNGVLFFEGHAASISATITREGFKTLLLNCAKRLRITVLDKRRIDSLLKNQEVAGK